MREFTDEELNPAITQIFSEVMHELYTWSLEKQYKKWYRFTLHGDVQLLFHWKKITTYALYCMYVPCPHYTLNQDDIYILDTLTKDYLTPNRIKVCIDFLKKNKKHDK